jgi:hypothetical protein
MNPAEPVWSALAPPYKAKANQNGGTFNTSDQANVNQRCPVALQWTFNADGTRHAVGRRSSLAVRRLDDGCSPLTNPPQPAWSALAPPYRDGEAFIRWVFSVDKSIPTDLVRFGAILRRLLFLSSTANK